MERPAGNYNAGANFWQEISGQPGISFFWAMPLCLVTQAIVGPWAASCRSGRTAVEGF